ncbi:spherulation-specific family 4 protein [Candidatus Solirubrobacter pratensis]|uniref:spherulation-specific family 4 protein n=1 Tax=Candidatus Solirubrobacter pratensis TaxID=1298857 RepID=UPI0003FB85F0|nr:spherulation-specific family 4 protein [Candidatus Solirubrobacter pratensis]
MSGRARLVIAGCAGVAAVVAAILLVSGGRADQEHHRALIPAYLPPAGIERLAAHRGNGSVLIVNPASGPGAAPDPAYARAVRAAQSAGWKVIGYVPTGYGARPAADVEADAERYAAWYHVDGIFLDEAAHTREHLAYYRSLRAHIPGLLAINPGVPPDRGYEAAADVIVTYEGSLADARARLRPPSWLPADRAAYLVHGAPEREARALVEAHRAGYLYVTSGTLPDPWSALPRYLDAELR